MNTGIVILAILLLYFFLPFFISKRISEKVLVISHRGGPVYHPENTLAAFKQAIDDGADGIEFDVQMSKDGQLVVIHDTTVDRTTNGIGPVGALPYKILSKLNAGNGEKIPSYREVISLAKNANIISFVEAKSPEKYPGLESLILDETNQIDYAQQCVFQSFDPRSVEMFGQLNNNLELSQLYGLWELLLQKPQPGNAQTSSLMAEMILLNPWMIYQAHKKGFKAVVWFGIIENPFTMRWMIKLGADGLIVNDHKMLLKILRR